MAVGVGLGCRICPLLVSLLCWFAAFFYAAGYAFGYVWSPSGFYVYEAGAAVAVVVVA